MKNRSTKVTIIIFVLVLALVGYYAYLSNRAQQARDESKTNLSPVQEVLQRDLSSNYPPTPKEVMKYYNSMMKCLYSGDVTDEELDDVGLKMRELYDPELKEANELGTYLIRLKAEVETYASEGKKLTGTSVAASTNVDYYTSGGYSFARLICTYNMSEKGIIHVQDEVYLLRKDETDKRWKIYGWDKIENVDLNGDGVKGD